MDDWSGLATEIILNILSRLTLEERWTGTMFVCKSWLLASRDPYLWPVFDLEPWFESPSNSARWWSPDFERRIDSMVRSVVDWSNGGLTEIRVRHCSDWSLSYVADRCPNLRIMVTRSCPNITDASMVKIAFGCKKLKKVDISYCHEISHETLIMIGRNCPDLISMKRNLMSWSDSAKLAHHVPSEYLDACPRDGDLEADAIGKHMPNLRHLEIQYSRLCGKGLTSICEGCQKLEYVDLSGCVHVSSRDIENATSRLKCLKELKAPRRMGDEGQIERYGHWRLYDDRFDVQALRF